MKKLLLALALLTASFTSQADTIQISARSVNYVGQKMTIGVVKHLYESRNIYIAIRLPDGRLLWLDRMSRFSTVKQVFAGASSPREDYIQVFSFTVPPHLKGTYTMYAAVSSMEREAKDEQWVSQIASKVIHIVDPYTKSIPFDGLQ